MTYGQLLVKCQDLSGDYDGTIATTFQGWLNDAQQDVATRYPWPFLNANTPQSITTVASTAEYDLASDCAYPYDVMDTTNNRKLRFMTQEKFDRAFSVQTAIGVSDLYTLTGQAQVSAQSATIQRIKFYPIPAGVYTYQVKYYKTVPDLSNNGDISLIPARYHRLLYWYALKNYFFKQSDLFRFRAANDEYENGLVSMAEELSVQDASYTPALESIDEYTNSPPAVQFPPNFERFG